MRAKLFASVNAFGQPKSMEGVLDRLQLIKMHACGQPASKSFARYTHLMGQTQYAETLDEGAWVAD